jgi:hypothetical protein
MYADDTTIVLSSPTITSLMNISVTALTQFSIWFNSNKLALNDKKTNFIIFSKSSATKYTDTDTLLFDNHSIKRTNSVRYLGVILDQHLTWHEHVNTVRDKAAKGAGIIKYLSNYLSTDFLLPIYNSFVLPYLTYCIKLWGNACMYYICKSSENTCQKVCTFNMWCFII